MCVFAELDDAIEWIEDCLIDEAALARGEEKPLELQEIELFKDRKSETLAAFEQFIEKRSYPKSPRAKDNAAS